jgi:hypothetical protein
MATSGTNTFNLTIDTVIQEAYERLGVSSKGGYDLITARRSLNLLMVEWINEGVNLFTLDLIEHTMTKDQNYITFSSNTYSDIMDAVILDTNADPDSDTQIERVSLADYLQIPTKTTSGKPSQFSVERNAQYTSSGVGTHKVYLWPVPDQTYYKLKAWMIKYPEDVAWAAAASGDTAGQVTSPYINYNQQVQIPKRMLPAMISGLTLKLAHKHPGTVDINRRNELAQVYAADWEKAKEEDRERVSFFVQPAVYY